MARSHLMIKWDHSFVSVGKVWAQHIRWEAGEDERGDRGITLSQIKSQSVIFRSNCPEQLLDTAKIVSACAFILRSIDAPNSVCVWMEIKRPALQTHSPPMNEGRIAARTAERQFTICHRNPADMRWWCQYILRLPSGGLLCITLKHELYEWNNAVLCRDVNQKGEKSLTSFAIKR